MAEVPIIPICKRLFFAAALIIIPGAALADGGGLSAYLRARVADADGRTALAAADYARALDAAPADSSVAVRAYREALAAGDDGLADRAAAILTRSGKAPPDVVLGAIARAAATSDPAAIDAAIAKIGTSPIAVIGASLRAWAAFGRGADPFAVLRSRPGDVVAARFDAENRGLLLLATGKTAEGVKVLTALLGTDQSSLDIRVAAAQILAAQGKAAAAAPLLVGDDPAIVALRRDAGKGVMPSFAFGASRLFSRIASDLAAGKVGPLSIALTRAALRADPGNDRARLLLANALAADGATAQAVAALDAVPPGSPYAAQARAGRVQVLAQSGDDQGALVAARAQASAPGATPTDIERLGDRLVLAGKNEDAAVLYKSLLKDRENDWVAWFQYGGALEQAGRWKEAEPALAQAVALAPDEPLALNYLGYARIDHGGAVAPSLALLERAHALMPDDPSILDSLGWGYFRAGQTARALPLIERAAAAAPDNAEIADHLGDLYWSQGRRYEARYAWSAAKLYADTEDAKRIAAKIANGLPAKR
ncbi:Tetratricopeptide repeat-containing protein [Sphingomonas sp. EC-HK361]|uniref:tetratricopeptide repeat protein n=1 Tax=Sphingomonas sp. EC-HK361 TaxID=2038397 RepID=UPI0012579F3B|nr:tetratricopeptide repeat protein [Sphingomonas sp. EC-HK361]VVT03214.1 Tetratricopeptide repeat-containing protein [Sphingomonas sp. EC-HK361]